YPFDSAHDVHEPHQGSITALHFTPETKLVSASRDGTVRVWGLYQFGARLDRREEGRQGTVPQLDVDQTGKLMLFDKLGKELQILSVDTGRYICSLQNPHGAIPFETFALFSPDASLLLTAGAAEGRLQLWQAPTERSRGFEVRQFVSGDRSPATCAAFDNEAGKALNGDGGFAVSGTKDGYVYVWAIPNKTDLVNHPILPPRPPRTSPSQENTQQIRISVELRNVTDEQHPDGRLTPGRPVTIVIE